jgi:hypothetical protein
MERFGTGNGRFSTLEIHFLFFTPQGGAEKSMNEFHEGTYPPQKGGTEQSTPLRGVRKCADKIRTEKK